MALDGVHFIQTLKKRDIMKKEKVKESTNKVLEQHKETFEKLSEIENNKNKDKKDD